MAEYPSTRRKDSVGTVEIRGQDGAVRTVNMDQLNDADKALAAEFGYKPVFKREFGYLSTFSFAVSISGLFATVATTFVYPLEAGGSASAVWCWLISGSGCMCIAVSVPPSQRLFRSCCASSRLMPNLVRRLRTRLGIPNLWWSLLHSLSSRSSGLGSVHLLGDRLAQHFGSNRWCCFL